MQAPPVGGREAFSGSPELIATGGHGILAPQCPPPRPSPCSYASGSAGLSHVSTDHVPSTTPGAVRHDDAVGRGQPSPPTGRG